MARSSSRPVIVRLRPATCIDPRAGEKEITAPLPHSRVPPIRALRRRLRQNVGLLMGLTFLSAPALAAEVNVTATTSVVSEYMSRGLRYGGPSSQTAIELNAGKYIFSAWVNVPLAQRVAGLSDPEIDLSASCAIPLNDRCSVVPSVLAYCYPQADPNNGFFRITAEAAVAFNCAITTGLNVTPKIYYDVVAKGPTFECNASWGVPCPSLRTELNFSASVGTYLWHNALNRASPAVRNRGDYYSVGVAVPFQITRAAKLTLGVAFHQGFDNYLEYAGLPRVKNPLAVGRVVLSLTCHFTF